MSNIILSVKNLIKSINWKQLTLWTAVFLGIMIQLDIALNIWSFLPKEILGILIIQTCCLICHSNFIK